MFKRILIANRGEIACRVMRTAQAMGVECVAVYSDPDRDAPHVRMADHAVRLGPAPVADSYLRGDLIVAAAQDTGAEAIHPGYGFLSENPDFVEAVAKAGLTFIGPSAGAIRAMGLKDAAKALMQKAGVPVVPGYQGDAQDADTLAKEAAAIGYPVLIKAVAGGGGKGMRLVEGKDAFHEALTSAQNEARTAFGNDRVLIEKFIQNPRHIEVQVFGDGQKAVHLFERDCSLQRRHQKVIEEAPAPGMTKDMRQAMGQAATRAAEAIGYAGAGTVEFIVDGSGPLAADKFWFMEMNTRLQVEHPVTEAITGIDLVAWQLQVAAGDPLPVEQDALHINGHAVEARIYAEDVPAGFLPATGRIAHLAFPAAARVDSGVVAGGEVSPWYDPMIAKVICHAADRDAAFAALARALGETEIAGLTTNVGFLHRLVTDTDVRAGRVETGLIGRKGDALTGDPPLSANDKAWAAVVAAGLDGETQDWQGLTLWSPLRRTITLEAGPVTLMVEGPDRIRAEVDAEVVALVREGHRWRAGTELLPRALLHGLDVTLFGPTTKRVGVVDPLARESSATGGDAVMSPMPGLIQSVSIAPGDSVAEGDRLVVLEAMKMEHTLRAPRNGQVARVDVSAGDQVAAGALLVALEPQNEEDTQ